MPNSHSLLQIGDVSAYLSNQQQICSLLRGGIAERGGVRVGHRIMSINGTTVVGVPHDKIVTLLASSVGEIRMKTCLTSLYRHMLGEEKAVFL